MLGVAVSSLLAIGRSGDNARETFREYHRGALRTIEFCQGPGGGDNRMFRVPITKFSLK